MDCNRILVRPGAQNGWLIEGGEREQGPYLSCDMALRLAVAEALSARRTGQPSHVEITNAAGDTVAIRCLCARFGR